MDSKLVLLNIVSDLTQEKEFLFSDVIAQPRILAGIRHGGLGLAATSASAQPRRAVSCLLCLVPGAGSGARLHDVSSSVEGASGNGFPVRRLQGEGQG